MGSSVGVAAAVGAVVGAEVAPVWGNAWVAAVVGVGVAVLLLQDASNKLSMVILTNKIFNLRMRFAPR